MPGANENVTDLRGLSINVCVQTVNTSRACLLISSVAVTDIVKLTPIHYTTLHYTTLHYTTLHYTTPHCTALRCGAVRSTRHDTTQYNTIQYGYNQQITLAGEQLLSDYLIEDCTKWLTLYRHFETYCVEGSFLYFDSNVTDACF